MMRSFAIAVITATTGATLAKLSTNPNRAGSWSFYRTMRFGHHVGLGRYLRLVLKFSSYKSLDPEIQV